MAQEVRTALLSLRQQQVEFQEHRQQLLGRQQQVDQHARETKNYWDEQQYWNQAMYTEQHEESVRTHQFSDVLQAQRAEQTRQDARLGRMVEEAIRSQQRVLTNAEPQIEPPVHSTWENKVAGDRTLRNSMPAQ